VAAQEIWKVKDKEVQYALDLQRFQELQWERVETRSLAEALSPEFIGRMYRQPCSSHARLVEQNRRMLAFVRQSGLEWPTFPFTELIRINQIHVLCPSTMRPVPYNDSVKLP
jgi:hypothetical protein